jgi:TIGR03009 family protein
MRRDSWLVVVLAVAASVAARGPATAQEASKGAAPAAAARPPVNVPDPARMKQILTAWEQQSAKLKSLDVGIARLDDSPAWGKERFRGRAILMSPNLAWLDFQKETQDAGKSAFVPHERIVCTGKEVWQYRSDTHQIFIYTLDQQNQKRALEEGPLPFLFNMKAADAEARYQMALVNETQDYFVISVVPRLQIDRESFLKAFLKLNRTTFLPDRIYLVSPDGKSTKDFTLTAVKPNAAVAPENFKGQTLPKPWTVVRDPVAGPNNGGAQAQGIGSRPTAGPAASAPNRRR